MGYAGTCGDSNLQNDDDSYFNSQSYDEMVAYTTGDKGSCAVQTTTGNHPPVVNAGQNYTIPNNTPFQLTGSATDPDGDSLTYVWEEEDNGGASQPNSDDGSRPLFRSILPGTSPTRMFPQLANVLANITTALGDTLPTSNRTLHFRLVARDNRAGGGGASYAAMTVGSVTSAGPFRVTAPATDTWAISSTQTVTWDVANTDQAPVSCAQVNILLSTDAGQTFPVTLAANAPNSGSQTITVPNNPTGQGRVEVACSANLFFDISHGNLTISTTGKPPDVGTPTPIATPATATPTEVPTATETPCVMTFTDVPTSAWFYDYVHYLYCNEYINGYADNTFRPANSSTRAQLVKIITLAFDLGQEPPPGEYTFADVLPSNTFFSYIEAAASAGAINGYTCGGPGEHATPCTARTSAPATTRPVPRSLRSSSWPTIAWSPVSRLSRR
ncbi:MAG: S-layer homology domain-containing protein [Chloroflexia bacterium]